ncbi:tyrosine-type recombinase/integrase [Melissococcus plutonius]|uniref:tyrosine-type recombinase/integrase n=1 Tax=Melissococcus plutonius TaxID=33970 RepID=UPI003EE60BED
MAMIKKYIKKDGSSAWYFKTYLGVDPITGKKRYTTKRGFRTQKEAKIALARLEMKIEKNGLTELARKVETFSEIYNLWYEQYKNTVKQSTLFVQKNAIDKHILPRFGALSLDKITVVYCQKQVNDWFNYYQKYSNLIGLTSRIIDYGIKLGQISTNPMQQVIRPKKSTSIDQVAYHSPFYDKKELETFLALLKRQEDIQIYTMFRILSFTGLRKGELQGLRWKDIDFEKNILSVNQTLAKNEFGKEIFQTPKTKHSRRTLSLDKKTVSIIKLWKKEQQKRYLKLGINTLEPEQLIFTDINNKHIYLDYLNNFLKTFLRNNNLKKITIHGFRHTHCSLLFEAGASIKEVQERLGHTDIKTTMDIYTHVTEKAKEETADKFAAYLNF